MKTLLITGATSGLGLMLSRYYDSMGFNLITVGRDKNKLQLLKKDIAKKNQKNCYAFDLMVKNNYKKFLKIIKKQKIDAVIHCIGGGFGLHNPVISQEDLNFYLILTYLLL